jgi:hypothetical protein
MVKQLLLFRKKVLLSLEHQSSKLSTSNKLLAEVTCRASDS